ncbi:MAG: argininosuccinate lyase [Gammaproteobacteria bacterium]
MADFLWQKDGADIDARVMQFMAGDDVLLDRDIFIFDLRASRAHAEGLRNIEVLSDKECTALCNGLSELEEEFKQGRFVLDERFEDGHSAIEAWLTEHLGDVGKKIHTGRSRNDQVLVATRLYLLDALGQLGALCTTSARAFLERASADPATPMPGYTHLQHAVVSSTGHWYAGYAEAFADNAQLAFDTRRWISCNPLGTAAGFGVNLPLDRDHTTHALGFERLQINPMYAQNSRGKFEIQALTAMAQALLDLRRTAWDLSLFCMPELGYVTLPDRFTTGSSIMPNKRNPDLIELLRASYGVVSGALTEIQSLLALPGAYHRDLQFTKGPMLRATRHALQALSLLPDLINTMRFDADRLRNAIEPEMFATDVALQLAANGVPFRDAYRQALGDRAALEAISPAQSLAARTSMGAPGNLQLESIEKRIQALIA